MRIIRIHGIPVKLSACPRFWQAFSVGFRCFFATFSKILCLPLWIMLCYNGPNEVFSGFLSGSHHVHPSPAFEWLYYTRTGGFYKPPRIHHRSGQVLVAGRSNPLYNPIHDETERNRNALCGPSEVLSLSRIHALEGLRPGRSYPPERGCSQSRSAGIRVPGILDHSGLILVADRLVLLYNPSILIRNTNEIHSRHPLRSSLCGTRFWSCNRYGIL